MGHLEAARLIDARHDAMLVDGMPKWQALQVEQSREAAHRALLVQALQQALTQ